MLAAACGTSKSSTTAAGGTSTTAKGGSSSSSFAAYAACLKKNGVTLPAGLGAGRPGGSAGSGAPTGTFPPGGLRGAGGAAGSFRNNPAFQKAQKACASLRPSGGGFGGRGGAGNSAFQAFASCMSSHGITIRGRGFGGPGSSSTSSSVPASTVDTSSPQYQAAYGTCKALLPTPAASTTTTAA